MLKPRGETTSQRVAPVAETNQILTDLNEMIGAALLIRYELAVDTGRMNAVFLSGDREVYDALLGGRELEAVVAELVPGASVALTIENATLNGSTSLDGRPFALLPVVSGGEVRGCLAAIGGRGEELGGQSIRLLNICARIVSTCLYAWFARVDDLIRKLSWAEEEERSRIAEVFHGDLQQLLAGAKVHVDAAARRAGRESPLKERLENAANLLNGVIDRTRTLSHQISPPSIRRGGLFEGLTQLAAEVEANLDLRVELTKEGEPPKLAGDVAITLYRAVQELLLNVAKHADVDSARVELRRDSEGLRLTVRDHGKGFDLEKIRRHSRGLGFLTFRERLAAVGGSLKVESIAGEGSTVSMHLPDRVLSRYEVDLRRGEGSPSFDASRASERQGSIRVLLVDDHAVIRQGLRVLLKDEEGIEVIGEAKDGAEAIKKARELDPAVVVMDYSMPGNSGAEVTRRLTYELPRVRVVGLSMHDEAETRREMLEAGAAAHLPKEAPAEALIDAIRRAVL